jgi:hypothetical protein
MSFRSFGLRYLMRGAAMQRGPKQPLILQFAARGNRFGHT